MPLLAALLAVGQDWLQKKVELAELPKRVAAATHERINSNIKSDLQGGAETIHEGAVAYARGVLDSPSGQAALNRAAASGKTAEVRKVVLTVVAQTATRIEQSVARKP